MSLSEIRVQVLKSFKNIHRTRCYVFQGDTIALEKARKEINDNYRKNKDETNEEKIKELVQLANDVIKELKTSVLQFKEVEPGTFRLQLRPELLANNTVEKNRKSRKKE